jgi:hypothetical protein
MCSGEAALTRPKECGKLLPSMATSSWQACAEQPRRDGLQPWNEVCYSPFRQQTYGPSDPMSVNVETVRGIAHLGRIAHLARIALREDEVDHLHSEVSAILTCVEQQRNPRRANDLSHPEGDEDARGRGRRRLHRRVEQPWLMA